MAASGVAPLVLILAVATVLPLVPARGNSTVSFFSSSSSFKATRAATRRRAVKELMAADDGFKATRAATRRACTYTVKVKTSCASPARTTDAVSLAFGDAYRNEAHVPRLPDGGNGGAALGRCATDTFRVAGPCGYGVCYLYLRRTGFDGWAPEWVQVVQPGPVTATFYFGDPLREGVWYGHDRCPKAAAAGGSSSTKPTAKAAATDARRASNSSAAPVQG